MLVGATPQHYPGQDDRASDGTISPLELTIGSTSRHEKVMHELDEMLEAERVAFLKKQYRSPRKPIQAFESPQVPTEKLPERSPEVDNTARLRLQQSEQQDRMELSSDESTAFHRLSQEEQNHNNILRKEREVALEVQRQHDDERRRKEAQRILEREALEQRELIAKLERDRASELDAARQMEREAVERYFLLEKQRVLEAEQRRRAEEETHWQDQQREAEARRKNQEHAALREQQRMAAESERERALAELRAQQELLEKQRIEADNRRREHEKWRQHELEVAARRAEEASSILKKELENASRIARERDELLKQKAQMEKEEQQRRENLWRLQQEREARRLEEERRLLNQTQQARPSMPLPPLSETQNDEYESHDERMKRIAREVEQRLARLDAEERMRETRLLEQARAKEEARKAEIRRAEEEERQKQALRAAAENPSQYKPVPPAAGPSAPGPSSFNRHVQDPQPSDSSPLQQSNRPAPSAVSNSWPPAGSRNLPPIYGPIHFPKPPAQSLDATRQGMGMGVGNQALISRSLNNQFDQVWYGVTHGPSQKVVDWNSIARIPITLGRLVSLKAAFRRANTDGTGHMDLFQLGQWAQDKGMKNISFEQLRHMLAQVDVNKNGFVEFWEFFAIQVYLSQGLRHSVDLTSFLHFVNQAYSSHSVWQTPPLFVPRKAIGQPRYA
eukprot:TRINITY_DN3112_c0_g1_i1.p1 TRINITY_DN3112_c0_g1~~TRINITY_DN3112_c0_g1_i1.p1  ORF type:complete len:692 (-),score=130.12 TRINITY_DN3112_c0_g1_i1:52-2094(-)